MMRFSSGVAAAILALASAAPAWPQVEGYLAADDPAVTQKPRFLPHASMSVEYPASAIRKKQEGDTAMTMCVSLKGKTSDVVVVESSGHPVLDKAAIEFAKNMRFNPAETGDEPVGICGFRFNQSWRLP